MDITTEEYLNAKAKKVELRNELFNIKLEIAHLPKNADISNYILKEEKIKKTLASIMLKITMYENEERGKNYEKYKRK